MTNVESVLKTFRRIGPVGPIYQVLSQATPLKEGDCFMKICLVESGEKLDYRLSAILHDSTDV
jgi:Family of unknown function (DUF5397)